MLMSPRLLAGLAGLVLILSLPAADAPSAKPQTPNAKPGWPGRQPDGSVLLPNMWSLRPAGTQVDLADFPVDIALHPDGKLAWGAEKSRKMDFTKEDAADDLLLNEIIWRSVRGPQSKMPAPVRAAFVFTKAGGDDDD